ncbi:MAG: hypothetical protein A3J46_01540 [Candidatus Yanofskybacteria bacterium RIFCSPHIGHO2_02_FULL_41_11]|uniref:Uncharacterized protein n=1 Tax=Candidatus Yanofskybacteria bacterium RIFCSPHIGHO2_02_FULL_41_11 TaxID=1802675 RepID=A0A1F8F938_9BACT|nr:MAG: hypothetical protein A3J46_01540 [Candidatus Yanofskybacteria bacterium RIFCSPHIGHO2_02_FULL_41_11]
MLIPTSINPESLLGFLAILPFIIGYGAPQPPRPELSPLDRRTPEEKAFDRMIWEIDRKIEKLTQLKNAYLQQRDCERELRAATGNIESLRRSLESMKKLIEELSKVDPSET